MNNRVFHNNGSQAATGGYLLVASPEQGTPLFRHGVVLVLEHSTHGARGVLLNRPIAKIGQPAKQLYFGGPTPGPMMVIASGPHEGLPAGHDMQTGQELLSEVIDGSSQAASGAKAIVGQIEWEAGELDSAISGGQWLPLPLNPRLALADPDEMWQLSYRQYGNRLVAACVGAKGLPPSPLAN